MGIPIYTKIAEHWASSITKQLIHPSMSENQPTNRALTHILIFWFILSYFDSCSYILNHVLIFWFILQNSESYHQNLDHFLISLYSDSYSIHPSMSGNQPTKRLWLILGRGDFNFFVLECFGELPYDVGYQKKHIRPYGGGWGLLLYPAQLSRGWLNFSSKAKTAFC